MLWQDVNKKLIALGSIGIIGLFSMLFLLTGIDYTYSGDTVCDGLNCSAYINISTTYWRVCFANYSNTKYENETLFKKMSRSRTLHVNLNKIDRVIKTEPEIPVDWLVPTRGKDNWRPLKDGDCWNRLRVNKIKLIGHPSEGQVIKWTFDLDKVQIDPIWVSYNYIYENLSREVPVYKEVEIKEVCYMNLTTSKENCIPAYNITEIESVSENIIEVKEECYINTTTNENVCSKAYNYIEKTGVKIEYYQGEKIGVKAGNKTYMGIVNIKGNILSEFNVPIGDRNFEDRTLGQGCRKFEIEKGVCKKTDLLEVNKIET